AEVDHAHDQIGVDVGFHDLPAGSRHLEEPRHAVREMRYAIGVRHQAQLDVGAGPAEVHDGGLALTWHDDAHATDQLDQGQGGTGVLPKRLQYLLGGDAVVQAGDLHVMRLPASVGEGDAGEPGRSGVGTGVRVVAARDVHHRGAGSIERLGEPGGADE